MIDLTIQDQKALDSAVEQARRQGITIPTLRQLKAPRQIPLQIRRRLSQVGLWDLDPINLFRINWHNQPVAQGGGFGGVNFLELPSSLTGVDARIISLIGKWFPTGVHKVGAAFGCLVPALVTGRFDPARQAAVWPSTGNFCRGGAYDSHLLGCKSIAVLPEGMSRERFKWLESVAGEVIRTSGSESNVKEIFDKCWELRRSGQELHIFNQFEEFGNYLWHYHVTGAAMQEVLEQLAVKPGRFQGVALSTGSGGTLAAGDFLKQRFPSSRIAAAEALQCPTLLMNGFGAHRIEGIGDKHIPWIHNVRNTDLVIAVDDAAALDLMRLFNEDAGREYLSAQGLTDSVIGQLDLLGISGIANLLACIKFAKHFELGSADVVLTVATDSMELYASRLQELKEANGPFTQLDAAAAYHRRLLGESIGHMQELDYYQRKRIHNLKYFTWVEQQGKTSEELQDQWHEAEYWACIQNSAAKLDARIEEFNRRTGLAADSEDAAQMHSGSARG